MKQYTVVFGGNLDMFKFNEYNDVVFRSKILSNISFCTPKIIEVTNEDLVLFDETTHNIQTIFGQ